MVDERPGDGRCSRAAAETSSGADAAAEDTSGATTWRRRKLARMEARLLKPGAGAERSGGWGCCGWLCCSWCAGGRGVGGASGAMAELGAEAGGGGGGGVVAGVWMSAERRTWSSWARDLERRLMERREKRRGSGCGSEAESVGGAREPERRSEARREECIAPDPDDARDDDADGSRVRSDWVRDGGRDGPMAKCALREGREGGWRGGRTGDGQHVGSGRRCLLRGARGGGLVSSDRNGTGTWVGEVTRYVPLYCIRKGGSGACSVWAGGRVARGDDHTHTDSSVL